MIVGVIANFRSRWGLSTTNQTLRTAISCAWRGDGVFTIKATGLGGQNAFAITENYAVLVVREISSGKN